MKKKLLLLTITLCSLFFYQCTLKNNQQSSEKDELVKIQDNESEEKEDGIREIQEMEFEMTKDLKLGYIPKYRLVDAYEKLMLERKTNGPSAVNALSWTERGPNTDVIGPSNGNTRGTQAASDAVTSGRMRAILVDADGSVWAGSVSGGLWHNTNIASTAAANWSLVNDFLGNLAVSSICQNPANANVMYFGTGEKTFNTDAVRGAGIWKSTDHGVTWNLLPSTSAFNNISKVLCDGAGNVYATSMGLFGANGVLRSTDGGANWVNITPTGLTTYATELRLSSTGRLHVVCGYGFAGGISGYRFTDIPATVTAGGWTAPTTTFPTGFNTELAVAGNTLYAEPADASYLVPAIYKSTDGGANWATTTTSPPGGTAEPSILPGGQGWYDLAIGVDPADPNIVIAGGLNFYRSINGGATWTQITRWVGTAFNYVHADHHAVVWSGTQVFLGTDGGLFYSNNNGASFTDRNDGLRLKQFFSCAIHPTTTNYFIAGAQDNGTHQLSNPGLSGSVEVVGGDGSYTHIDQNEPQYQFSGFTRSSYLRSTNSGASWGSVTFSTSIGQFINPTDYDDIGNKMYTSAGAGQYVRWENPQTGSNFTSIAIPAFNNSSVLSVMVSPYTPNRVFFGTAGGRVVRVDNANTGTPTGTNITGSSMSASTVSCVAVGTTDNNLLATFSNYGATHVWASTTGGGAGGWTNISGNLPDIPVRWAMFYPEDNTKAIIATEMGVYETDLINGASTVWVQNVSFPVVKTNMLQYRKSDGTVIAATHGRGLWTASIPIAAPYVRFADNYNYQTETTTSTTATCRNYTDYTVNMTIDQAPTGNANITVNVAGTSTATQGLDFDYTTNGNFAAPSNTLSFASGSTTPQPVTIRVYNDGEVDGNENVVLNYSIGGGTNAQAAPSGLSYTFTIVDNDIAPIVPFSGTNYAVGVNNALITAQAPFQSNLAKFRMQTLFSATEVQASGIVGATNITAMNLRVTTKNSTQPYTGFTISMANTTTTSFSNFIAPAFTQVYSGTFSSVVGDNNIVFTTPFVWDGTSNVVVQFCYDNGTTPDVLADVMEGAAAPMGTGIRTSVYSNATVGTGCSLGAAFIADSRIRAIFSANGGTVIETVLNSNKTEYIANNSNYYFYNAGKIINSITTASANLSCVSSNIFEAGTTWQTFSSGQRSQKVIEVIPTTNSGASYTISMYYTAAELAGKAPASLKIAKTSAATLATANAGNTVIGVTSFAAFGTGYVFTASFTGFSKFFLIDNNVVLPVDLISFSGVLDNNYHSQLQWRTENQYNLNKFEVQRSYDGVQFNAIGEVAASANSSAAQDYNFRDPQIAKAVNFYRLKMIDNNGSFKISPIVKINNKRSVQFVELLKNPVTDNISFVINNQGRDKVSAQLLNNSGQLVDKWDVGNVDGTVVLPLHKQISSGMYILRISAGNKVESLKLNKL